MVAATPGGAIRRQTRRTEWLKLYAFDVLTLLITTVIVLKFWWVYFGLQNRLWLAAVAAASFTEVARRALEACGHGRRPETICGERRADLVAGILLGTGPWPIARVLESSPAGVAWHAFDCPMWIQVAAVTGILGISAWRLLATHEATSERERRPLIRDLETVPALHTASLMMLPASAAH